MTGHGGTTDFAAQQAADDAKKQKARDALNAQFGIQGSGAGAPNQRDYMHFVGDSTSMGNALIGDYGDRHMELDQAAWDKAQADWAAQQAQVGANAAAKEQLYGKVRQDAFDAGKRRLDEQASEARRAAKFELFSHGLNGGSVDIDQNALLQRTYDQGVVDLGAKADSVANDMRTADEQTRLGLLQAVNSGMDQGSAISSAIGQMRTNADKAASAATGTALGDLFAGGGAIYNQSVQRRMFQLGRQSVQPNGTRTTSMNNGTTGSTGTISSTGN